MAPVRRGADLGSQGVGVPQRVPKHRPPSRWCAARGERHNTSASASSTVCTQLAAAGPALLGSRRALDGGCTKRADTSAPVDAVCARDDCGKEVRSFILSRATAFTENRPASCAMFCVHKHAHSQVPALSARARLTCAGSNLWRHSPHRGVVADGRAAVVRADLAAEYQRRIRVLADLSTTTPR